MITSRTSHYGEGILYSLPRIRLRTHSTLHELPTCCGSWAVCVCPYLYFQCQSPWLDNSSRRGFLCNGDGGGGCPLARRTRSGGELTTTPMSESKKASSIPLVPHGYNPSPNSRAVDGLVTTVACVRTTSSTRVSFHIIF